MIFHESTLNGAFVIEPECREDERGFFARTWCQKEFASRDLNPRVVQANLSYNRRCGTIRGLHYQIAPHEESKVVYCIRGAIYDVILDLRPQSPSYLQWCAVDLTAENRKMLYVPAGVAHGFQTLEDNAEVCYLMSEFYTPAAARGVRWDDPLLRIDWPHVEDRVVSETDQTWPLLSPAARRLPAVERSPASQQSNCVERTLGRPRLSE